MTNVRKAALRSVQNLARDAGWQLRRDLVEDAGSVGPMVLDLGCGSKPYRDLFTNAEVYIGIDLPADLSANKLGKSIDIFADLRHLPIRGASFDAVVCTQVLEHVSDPTAVLREAARVLSVGGRILITIPFLAAEHEEPHDYFRYTQYGIRSLLEASGFEEVVVKKQFGFWAAIGEMIYWHFHRKVRGGRLEKYWYAVGTTLFLRLFHLLNWLDPDDKLALNLCVTARRKKVSNLQLHSEATTALPLSA